METIVNELSEVAVIKGSTPKETFLKGLEILGGISKYIKTGETVFIKFNLILPNGFPTNTNLDVLEVVIRACIDAGAKKVYLGSFPFKGISIKAISDLLGYKNYFENLGAELAFLDNSNYFSQKGFKIDQIKKVKEVSFKKIEINNQIFKIPKIIMDSDKLISVNQVNVEPLFKCTLSINNSYSMVPYQYQKIKKNGQQGENYLVSDQFKQDLVSNIIDVFTIKKPDLVVNDLFYILEGAGPYIYKDSKLKKTGIIVMGSDAVAVDTITLKLSNFDILENDLLIAASERNMGQSDPEKIKIVGETLENNNFEVKPCVSSLEDIKVRNFSITKGQFCSGCYKEAYHLLNLVKTNMIKDLKYISKNFFLIGENPVAPDFLNNIIIFGDCAINSTKNNSFRTVVKISKKKKKKKEKKNKKILELPGCPPDLFNCVKLMKKYYGKGNAPTLSLFYKISKLIIGRKKKKKLDTWEAL